MSKNYLFYITNEYILYHFIRSDKKKKDRLAGEQQHSQLREKLKVSFMFWYLSHVEIMTILQKNRRFSRAAEVFTTIPRAG